MTSSFQIVLYAIVEAALLYMILDALITRSIWVRGAGGWRWSVTQWAHKKHKEEEPKGYWFFFCLYCVAFIWLAYLWWTGSLH